MKNLFNYDLIVVGGGTSGCSAAYNASKLGLKTLLVEKNNFLGGLMTGGLVVPVMKSSVKDVNCDYYKKLVSTAKKFNAQITYKDKNDGWFNPEVLKIVLDDILFSDEIRKNLDILFETTVKEVEVSNKKISKIILATNSSTITLCADNFIDCTGNADVCLLSGCEFISNNDEVQKNSLRFVVGNVNIEKFSEFIKQIDNDENITNTYRNDTNTKGILHFTTASTSDTTKIWNVDKILKKAVDDGVLLNEDRDYFQIFSVAGSTNQVAFNCPRINNFKDNPFKASLELIYARKAIYRLFNFVKKYFVGFENAEIVNIASQTGVREFRRVKTKYIYNMNDLTTGKKFDTPVLMANYPIDVHSDKNSSTITKKDISYELPIEALMSYDVDNLFVAGKIIGADFVSHSALRVQKSCMSMAEGVVKYICKNK